MKKLFPLLVIAAGAVAYGIYKNKKETDKEEKTFVCVNDAPEDELPSDDSHFDEPENPMKDVEEAVQEVQEELGVFETLTDLEEPYERPSFFHLTQDSYLEPEEVLETETADDSVIEEEPEQPALIVLDTEETAEADMEIETVEAVEKKPVEAFEEPEQEAVLVEIVEEAQEEVVTSADEPIETEDESAEEAGVEQETVEEINEAEVIVDDTEQSNDIESVIEEIAQKIEEAADEYSAEESNEESIEETVEEELEPLVSYDTPELDALMKEIAGQVKAADHTEQQPADEVPEPSEETEEITEEPSEESDYLQDIRKITEMYSDKVAQYNIRYPYLSSRFIDDTLKFSQQFNVEYPQGTRVAIEHQAYFNATEDLFVFAQIIRQIGYSVREGAESHCLIVMKEMYVDTNTILHDVFKVANQVYCLSGEYQKFRITKR